MVRKPTLPFSPAALEDSISIRTLRVQVIEGEDTGLSVSTESERLSVGSATTNDLVLADPTVSRFHLELTRDRDGVQVRDAGSTNGIYVGGVRVAEAIVPLGTEIRLGASVLKVAAGESKNIALHDTGTLSGLHGESAAMRRLMASVARLGKTRTPTLVVGEPGTGKERVARALHNTSPRRSGPFRVLDCSHHDPEILARELFGEGDTPGALEQTSGGTLLLDSVSELPGTVQGSLLRALARNRVRRVGDTSDRPFDVRLISAASRDLRADVNTEHFRLDLYYRIAVVVLTMPPLRERRGDIPLLVSAIAEELGGEVSLHDVFPKRARSAMQRYRWPGNVRELRNLVEMTMTVGAPPRIDQLLDDDMSEDTSTFNVEVTDIGDMPYRDARARVLHEFESHYLKALIQKTRGNVSQAAREADMDRSHLFQMLKRHGLR